MRSRIGLCSNRYDCLFVGMLLLLQATASFAASKRNNKLLSLELIPHHAQKKRRLQGYVIEPSANVQDYHNIRSSNNINNSSLTKEQFEAWRRHCPRFQLLDDAQEGNRELGATFSAQQVAGLFQGYGTHYADLWCGTPPQRQTVIVDTGSGVTAFPGSSCTDCGVPKYHIDKLFDESKSSTFRIVPCGECLRGHCSHSHCEMGQSYAEGSSWSAHEAEDLCYVGGLHNKPVVNNHNSNNNNNNNDNSDDIDPYAAPNFAFRLKFGLQTHITGLFKTQLADGIMGMDIAEAAFWEQMYKAGKIENKAFSLCFSRSPTASRDGTGAGAMSLGGSDERLHQTEMVYTATDTNVGFYVVHLRKAYLRAGGGGDSALSKDADLKIIPLDVTEGVLNRGNVIVDSGTTDTYFHRGIAPAFQAAFQEFTGKKLNHDTVKMTKEEIDALPTILFQMKGDLELNQEIADRNGGTLAGLAGTLDPDNPYDVLLAIPPSHYMEYDEDDGKYTARFYTDESRGSVLGANAMMGHDVLFDVENGKVGWAESDCDYKRLVDEYYNGKLPVPSDGGDSKREDKVEPNDDSRFKPEDIETVDIIDNPPKQFCTSLSCQLSAGFALVGAIVLIGVRLARGSFSRGSHVEYELSAAELEMQTPPSAYRDDDDDDDEDNDNEKGPPSSYRDDDEVEHGEFT